MSQFDIRELAALLSSLSFQQTAEPTHIHDVSMSDEERGYNSDTPSTPPAPTPCELLHAFASCHAPDTAGVHIADGELSQLIFAHRDAYLAYPRAHTGCSAGFSRLAAFVEQRADMAGLLRSEAWLLSGWSS
ncbi:hypothetical protein BC834DRAFT_60660 [Gloeopeniophorella convolvens]|nr:hypothetical protein BC834DRAFT_60660 [Gloeopeniophorella convolvens]